MQLKYTDDFVHVQTDDPKAKLLLDRHLNAIFSKKSGYRLPRTLWVMRELLKAFPSLKNNAELIGEGTKLRAEQMTLLSIKNLPEGGFEKDFAPQLREYQKADVIYLQALKSAGIFNEPRTGKTPTAITLMRELGTMRNLIVAPASLVLNWALEFKKWWPECTVLTINKRNRGEVFRHYTGKTPKPIVLIVSKSSLKLGDELLQVVTHDFCAVDEAHFLRNHKTLQSKAVFSIKAERRYALSGTPTVKHASDIWGILHFLFPRRFPSVHQFNSRYFEIGQDWMGHAVVGNVKPHREKELQEMTGFLSVNRKRKEVMQWLPDKQRTTIPVALEGKQKKLYDDMRKLFLASDDPIEVDAQNVIVQLMRLRQLCLDPRLLGFDVPGAKTEALLDFLENNGQPIVIMSWFTSYLKLLKPLIEKLGLKVGELHGQMSNEEKATAASAFQAGSIDVLCCNIVSAGVGFTLDRAETVIFLDKAWNPSENEQAEDRICPTVEEKNHKHEIISFICQDTIEQKIEDTLSQKKSLTDVINEGGREAIRRLLT